MPAAYSLDLRQKVLAAISDGNKINDIAETFKIARATIYYWLARQRQGNLAASKHVVAKPYKLDPIAAQRILTENSDATLKEMAEILGVTATAVWKHLTRNKITRKKNRPLSGARRQKTQ